VQFIKSENGMLTCDNYKNHVITAQLNKDEPASFELHNLSNFRVDLGSAFSKTITARCF